MDSWLFCLIFAYYVNEDEEPVNGDEEDMFADDAVYGNYTEEQAVSSGVLDEIVRQAELEPGVHLKFDLYSYEYIGPRTRMKSDVRDMLRTEEFVKMKESGELKETNRAFIVVKSNA